MKEIIVVYLDRIQTDENNIGIGWSAWGPHSPSPLPPLSVKDTYILPSQIIIGLMSWYFVSGVWLIASSCPFFCHLFPLFSIPFPSLSSVPCSPAPLFTPGHESTFNLLLFCSEIWFWFFKIFSSSPLQIFLCFDTSPPPPAPRPTPRPGGRAPPDPLPSVSTAPQQIGGMVWDFLGKWVLCPGT